MPGQLSLAEQAERQRIAAILHDDLSSASLPCKCV
jgi:signal transduction histidine kinase